MASRSPREQPQPRFELTTEGLLDNFDLQYSGYDHRQGGLSIAEMKNNSRKIVDFFLNRGELPEKVIPFYNLDKVETEPFKVNNQGKTVKKNIATKSFTSLKSAWDADKDAILYLPTMVLGNVDSVAYSAMTRLVKSSNKYNPQLLVQDALNQFEYVTGLRANEEVIITYDEFLGMLDKFEEFFTKQKVDATDYSHAIRNVLTMESVSTTIGTNNNGQYDTSIPGYADFLRQAAQMTTKTDLVTELRSFIAKKPGVIPKVSISKKSFKVSEQKQSDVVLMLQRKSGERGGVPVSKTRTGKKPSTVILMMYNGIPVIITFGVANRDYAEQLVGMLDPKAFDTALQNEVELRAARSSRGQFREVPRAARQGTRASAEPAPEEPAPERQPSPRQASPRSGRQPVRPPGSSEMNF